MADVANILGFGVMAVLGGEFMRNQPPRPAATVVCGLILLPVLLLSGIPAPGPDRRLARESFQAFWVDVFDLLRRREVLFALVLFAAPCATFSLTNLVAGIGGDFGATPRLIGILGGAGTAVAGVCGSLLLPKFAKHVRLRPLYLAIGVVGSLFTVAVLLLPRDVASFALVVCGESVFQSLAIACSLAITFEIIGEGNPLAATNFALLSGIYNIPSLILFVDGWSYGRWGVTGAFGVDAALGGFACLLMAIFLRSFERRRRQPYDRLRHEPS
jgi:MFS transporter, PAT family, beta-lactamase induction signal transducer AmpG